MQPIGYIKYSSRHGSHIRQEQLHGRGRESGGKSAEDIHCLCNLYQMHYKKIFVLENEGQGVQHSQWSNSMVNSNIYQSQNWALFAGSHLFRHIHVSKFVTLKIRSRSLCTTFEVAPFDGNYLTSYLMVIVMFVFLSLYLSKYPLEKFALENLGLYHGVQHSQWSRSMANINLYKSHSWTFFAIALIVFEILTLQTSVIVILEHLLSPFARYSHSKIRDLENVDQDHDLQHLQWHDSMANNWLPIWWQ